MEFMIIFIACLVAGLICLGLYSAMKPVSKQSTASQYVSKERLVMNINEDNFLRETESRTRIVNQAAPGMAAGSAGAKPGQNMTISASAVPPQQSGNTIHLGGMPLHQNGTGVHHAGPQVHHSGPQGHHNGPGGHGKPGTGQTSAKPDNFIDLSK